MPFPFTNGDVLNASDVNALSGGVMGYTRNTSPPALTTSEQDYATVTFTAVSGRLYLAIGQLIAFTFNNSGVLTTKIYVGSVRTGEAVFPIPDTTIDYGGATLSGYFTGSGSVTVDLRANVFGAATSATVGSTGDTDPYLMVLDVGAA